MGMALRSLGFRAQRVWRGPTKARVYDLRTGPTPQPRSDPLDGGVGGVGRRGRTGQGGPGSS